MENGNTQDYDKQQIVIADSQMPAGMPSVNFLNPDILKHMERAARIYSDSEFVPDHFRGKIANVLIAMDMAMLMGMNPFMLMRTMYIVHGKPGFEAKFTIALMNKSGLFKDPLEYEWKGDRFKADWGCRAFAVRKSTGKRVDGPWVEWKTVVDEGWNQDKKRKDGGIMKSKWNTMPDLMFIYRAATFFGRVNCPDLLMGMSTYEELQDQEIELKRSRSGTYEERKPPKPISGKAVDTTIYDVTAKPPAQEQEKSGPDIDKSATDTEAGDDFIPEAMIDEYGTPADSIMAKTNWFHSRVGKEDKTTGFAKFMADNRQFFGEASLKAWEVIQEKWQNFYGEPLPWDRNGIEIAPADEQQQPQNDQAQQAQDGQQQATGQPTDNQPNDDFSAIMDSPAAAQLAKIAKLHPNEYLKVVDGRTPESIAQIINWMEQINNMVVQAKVNQIA